MRWEVCHDTNDYVVTEGESLASRHGWPGAAIPLPTPYDKAQGRCDTTCGRDLCRDTILYRDLGRRQGCCDTASCWWPRRCARPTCAQPRSVVCAPNPVLTQDTVLSHCFGHCSLTLFMSTVYEVFKINK